MVKRDKQEQKEMLLKIIDRFENIKKSDYFRKQYE